jgi:beta-glucosidase
MNKNIPLILTVLTVLSGISCRNRRDAGDRKQTDPGAFVERLLGQMTLEEKIGQMTQICFSTVTADGSKKLVMDEDKLREAILVHHTGSFLSASGRAADWVDFITLAQRVAVEESRLGIPLLIGIDHVHGANYVDEGTILPHNLTLSCSFDTALVGTAARITVSETLGLGLVWNFAPVLDLGRNPAWPRFYETFGEDPLCCGEMGLAYIRNYRAPGGTPYGAVTCGKHFIGYSDPKTGRDRTPAWIPEQALQEYFIPPFRIAIEGGMRTMMLNSGELNGEPVVTSGYVSDHLLRGQLDFDGVVLTDIKDISKVVEMHAGAPDELEATKLALEAGVDMSMACNAYDFQDYVKTLVENGEVREKRIDRSVRRILRLKYDLGLFDHPFPSGLMMDGIGSAEHWQSAEEMASGSIVLLKNEGILPFPKGSGKILLGGFAADSKTILNGAWTYQWMGVPDSLQPAAMMTLLDAMEEYYGKEAITFLTDGDPADPVFREEFAQKARDCDLIVLTAGEMPYSEFKGDIDDLSLDDRQLELAGMAAESGKPVVLILLEGRPRVITPAEPMAGAILFAGIPGCGGGRALTRIISGEVNPSGRLSFTYPASTNHLVPYYHKASEQYNPLFPFGAGLSYTTYSYSDPEITDTLVSDPSASMKLGVTVTNTGTVAGKEVVLVYLRDRSGKITRPVKKLIAFRKVDLAPGESKRLEFRFIPGDIFSYPDRIGVPVLEEGWFDLITGTEILAVRYVAR